MSTRSFGADMRLRRLDRHNDGKLFVVPLDHSVADGPLVPRTGLDPLVGQLAGSGVDAIVLHRGTLRHVDRGWFAGMSLILHLSASTAHAPDPNAKYLVSSVESALRLGADAVSVHVNMGAESEREQIADFALVSDACERWNMPLMAMIYPRGPKISDPRAAEHVAHAASLGADLGADIVKTVAANRNDEMADIVRGCPIPIVAAGGPRLPEPGALDNYVRGLMDAGAAGVAMGRNVFQAPDPGATARRLAALIHPARVFDPAPELELSAR
ncbi:2-amino-3,7-dideoxy-D-threo-hept-6-ulosonate synthase [Saccharopolyspora taberi]|uniref:2-amino-3,7-dideoxy-D-threo-hept-6-ulosonate synthase n=1 Tax=Saccharopolyspora taberi TaxID=60895 RepID=A0ABN3V4F7_9PSEU